MCRALNGEVWWETLISVKTPPPSPETGHNGFGAVDASREGIEADTRTRLVGQPRPRPLSLPTNTQGTIESFIPRGVWDAPAC